MSMRYTYLVADFKDKYSGFWYAGIIKVSTNDNILSVLGKQGGEVVCANICETRKQAVAIAESWNEAHKRNGNSLSTAKFIDGKWVQPK